MGVSENSFPQKTVKSPPSAAPNGEEDPPFYLITLGRDKDFYDFSLTHFGFQLGNPEQCFHSLIHTPIQQILWSTDPVLIAMPNSGNITKNNK